MSAKTKPTANRTQIEHLPVEDLIPYARNSRTHSDEQTAQIAASIREFGFTNPVLIGSDNDIIAGHGRVLAARKLGLVEVPCIRLGYLTDAQKRAYVIADNKLALNAGWDEELLKIELAGLRDEDGFDLGLTGFSEDELAALLAEVTVEGNTDPDEVPEVPVNPVSVIGDVWVCDQSRVICGDATNADDWNRLQIGPMAMVFTSPPYGVGKNARIRDHYEPGSNNSRSSLYESHEDDPGEWPTLMRDWTALAVAMTDCVVCNVQMLANNKRSMLQWAHFFADHLIDVVVWDKQHGPPQMVPNILTNAFEWMFIFGAAGSSRSLPFANFHGNESNVVRVGRQSDSTYAEIHRATMPIELAEWAVRVTGANSKTVIDPFGGTGTTMIAAVKHGKRAGIIERDPQYVDVIVKRWQDFTGKQAVHAETGKTFDEMKSERDAKA